MIGPEGGLPPQEPPASLEPHEDDPIVRRVQERMGVVLPEYSKLDRSRWDTWDSAADKILYDRGFEEGRRLTFYKGEPVDTSSHIVFLQKVKGHTINYHNNPHGSDSESRISNPGGTVNKNCSFGSGDYWDLEDLERSTEATRLRIAGVPLDLQTTAQPAVVLQDNRVITLGEFLDTAAKYKVAKQKEKEELKPRLQGKDIYKVAEEDPELVKKLVLDRLAQQAKNGTPFMMDGKTHDPAAIIAEIQSGTPLGEKAKMLEVTQLGIYLEFLWARRMLLKP